MTKKSHIILDISRLIVRANAKVPTGIDRTELEYALFLLQQYHGSISFAAFHPVGRIGFLPLNIAVRFIQTLATHWRSGQSGRSRFKVSPEIIRQLVLFNSASCKKQNCVYLLVSHHHLTHEKAIASFLKKTQSSFAVMVHDLIPLEYPEYARPEEPQKHASRMECVFKLANVIIVPSQSVAASVAHYSQGRHHAPVHVVPHGCLTVPQLVIKGTNIEFKVPSQHYFIMLGTIEPRKNHLMILNIWRELVQKFGPQNTPHLLLIGRRGWENENILDMLERCPSLQGIVHEYSTLPDAHVTQLLLNAKALLFPSFSEGFGLPLLEALALQTPCICSNLPVFYEIAGNSAIYLDTLDGAGWQKTIRAFMDKSMILPPLLPPAKIRDWPTQVRVGMSYVEQANRHA
mgnify:CR=1 FL=1